jgi:hypothetical protein
LFELTFSNIFEQQGSEISDDHYVDLATGIQNVSTNLRLWVGIPQFLFSIPDQWTANEQIQTIIADVKSLGFTKITENDIFLSGHALGT